MEFDKVRPAEGSARAGFEELSVQLAEGICGAALRGAQRIDGSGGDGGVELIGTTVDGRRVGIQAKYFKDALGTSQWTQVKKSVSQAMANHPDLSDYFVCVPKDRNPTQINTWEKMERNWSASYPKLRVHWVGRFELGALLLKPEWNYLATYWLGAPEFSVEKLRQRTEASIAQLHRRFTPDLHNRTRAEVDLSRVLGLSAARREYRQMCLKVAVEINKLLTQLSVSKWPDDAKTLAEACAHASTCSRAVLDEAKDGELIAQAALFGQLLDEAHEALRELSAHAWSETRRLQDLKGRSADTSIPSGIARDAASVASEIEAIVKIFRLHHEAKQRPCWILVGEAGTGKSHLLATVARRALQESSATVMLLGEQFQDSRALHLQICDQLGWDRPFTELLECLRARSQEIGRPSLLVIDAINETPNRNIWLSQLVQLQQQVAGYLGVHLLLSCRKDWFAACVPHAVEVASTKVNHSGYDLDFEEVVSAYFSGYNVSADTFPPLVPEFRNPLFLKTVCETYQGKKLPARPLSFIEVLTSWEDRVSEEVEKAVDCPRSQTKSAMARIVAEMARQQSSFIDEQLARDICYGVFPNPTSQGSLYRQLQTQGFMEEVQQGSASRVRLQYERFYDVRVAQVELQAFPDLAAWRAHWSSSLLSRVGTWSEDQVPYARLFAYALLLPEKFGSELIELDLPVSRTEEWSSGAEAVWDAWLDALAWRQVPGDGNHVREHFIQWANADRRPEDVYSRLITFACIEQHPLNADFLHQILVRLSLVERESMWTIALAQEDLSANSDSELRNFVRWCDGAKRRCSDEQARLAATLLLWLTSTTNWRNRDRVTEVAIRLLDGRLSSVLALTDDFWEVNDSYVKERLLAVLAGVAPTLNLEALRTLGQDVCQRFFGCGDVPLNIMQREYARFIAEFCHQQGVMNGALLEACRPPYKSTKLKIWSEAKVKGYEKNKDYSAIATSLYPEEMGPGLYGDFGRYVMGSRVHYFVDDTKENPDAATPYLRHPREDARIARRYIWSRVIGMGWAPERFQQFERYLRSNGRERPSIERIGKKFQWIGLYEYLGYLSDNRAYMSWSDDARHDVRAADLLLRDFNPSLSMFHEMAESIGDELPLLGRQRGSPVPKMASMQERVDWVDSSFDTFLQYLHVDIDGKPRLVLTTHLDFSEDLVFGQTRSSAECGVQWVDIRSFLIPADQAFSLAKRLQSQTFWGDGCDLPNAYECWVSEYPWHQMLDTVEAACSAGEPWLRTVSGTFHGTACRLDSDDSRFVVPSPGVIREMSKSVTGMLSAPRHASEPGYRIDDACGEPVFWGSTTGDTLLAVDHEKLVAWLHERGWALMWCCLSERRAMKGYEVTVVESHQSAIFVLLPGQAPHEFMAVRKDWRNDRPDVSS